MSLFFVQCKHFERSRVYVLYELSKDQQTILTRFEDKQFITTHINPQQQGTIQFERYGLSLEIEQDKIKLLGTEYVLKNTSPFSSNVSALVFSNGQQDQCIIAVQPFYVDKTTPQTVGEYYQLTQDKTKFIANTQLKNLNPNLPIWNYHHSAQMLTCPLINGQPKPQNA